MIDSAITLALIGIVGTVITALFKLLVGNTKATATLSQAITDLVAETRKGNREAKQRNGHLGEQSFKIAELITKQNEDVAKISAATVKTAVTLSKSAIIAAEDRDVLTGNQMIQEQHVEHQIVGSTEPA